MEFRWSTVLRTVNGKVQITWMLGAAHGRHGETLAPRRRRVLHARGYFKQWACRLLQLPELIECFQMVKSRFGLKMRSQTSVRWCSRRS